MTPDDRDRDIGDELDFHLQAEQEELEATGLSPKAARRGARLDLGGRTQVQEAVREVWTIPFLDALWQDVRYAARRLWHQRGFAGIAIFTLAIAIGAATAVYSFVDQVLLEPPRGVTDPETLVNVFLRQAEHPDNLGILSLYHFTELEAAQTTLTSLFGDFQFEVILGSGKSATQASVDFVTGGFFSGLGIPLLAGRGIEAPDNVPNGPPSVVLTEHVWRQQFDTAPDIVGRQLTLNGKAFTVVGVASDLFEGLSYSGYGKPDAFAAVHAYTPVVGTARVTRRTGLLGAVGRLKPGTTIASAEAELSTAAARLSYAPTDSARYNAVAVFPLDKTDSIGRTELRNFLGALLAVSLLILLAACTNIANFLIGHGITRRGEMAMRLALGASRRRLLQQLLTESIVLGMAGGALGLLIALWLVGVLEAYPPSMSAGYTASISIHLGPGVWLFGVGSTLAAIAIFGTLPAVLASSRTPSPAMKIGAPAHARGKRLSSRHALLGLQVAVSVMLAIVATLYARSLAAMNAVDYGVNTENVLLARVAATSLPPTQQKLFYQDLLDKLRAHPLVASAAVASNPPLSIGGVGVQLDPTGPLVRADFATVTSSYFQTLGIPLVAGRDFHEGEAAAKAESGQSGDQTVILTETLAAKLWPGQGAVGRQVRIPGLPPPISTSPLTVIGLVRQPRCQGLLDEPMGCVYLGLNYERPFGIVHIRTRGNPEAFLPVLRQMVHDFSPEIPIDRISTLDEQIRTMRAAPRISVFMTGALAVLTALLAIIGCVGLLTSLVNEGRREIAIRLALGCTTGRLVRGILWSTVIPSLVGIAGGGYAAYVLTIKLVAPQLYHTAPDDPYAFVVVPLVFAGIGLAASYWPARAAARTDPAVMLRCD